MQRIQAVDRAIVLLKAVAASATPPTVLELARRCGINRATAWRLLRTLEHHGLVDRDVVTQRYTVGYGATVIASAVTDDALVRRVRPLLTDLCLRTGERGHAGRGQAVQPGLHRSGGAPMNSARRLREIGREAVRTAAEIRELLD